MRQPNRDQGGKRGTMVVVALLAAAFALHDAHADQRSWDEIVKAANAEGEVDVHGGTGEVYHQGPDRGFPAGSISADQDRISAGSAGA